MYSGPKKNNHSKIHYNKNKGCLKSKHINNQQWFKNKGENRRMKENKRYHNDTNTSHDRAYDYRIYELALNINLIFIPEDERVLYIKLLTDKLDDFINNNVLQIV